QRTRPSRRTPRRHHLELRHHPPRHSVQLLSRAHGRIRRRRHRRRRHPRHPSLRLDHARPLHFPRSHHGTHRRHYRHHVNQLDGLPPPRTSRRQRLPPTPAPLRRSLQLQPRHQ